MHNNENNLVAILKCLLLTFCHHFHALSIFCTTCFHYIWLKNVRGDNRVIDLLSILSLQTKKEGNPIEAR